MLVGDKFAQVYPNLKLVLALLSYVYMNNLDPPTLFENIEASILP